MESSEPHPILPQLRLDDLLSELQGRLQAVVATRDRVHGLLEAVLAVGSNLELEAVLRRIVEAAVALVDAQYGALGVVGEDGGWPTSFRSAWTRQRSLQLITGPKAVGCWGS